MIAVDTNLLVYAHRSDSSFHGPAAELVRELAEGRGSWAIPWPCLHELLAIVTHPRIYDPPTPVEQALEQVDAWLHSPSLSLLTEGPNHWATLARLARDGQIAGPRYHDTHIAAICLDAGVQELWSADRDLGRFPVRVINPLTA